MMTSYKTQGQALVRINALKRMLADDEGELKKYEERESLTDVRMTKGKRADHLSDNFVEAIPRLKQTIANRKAELQTLKQQYGVE